MTVIESRVRFKTRFSIAGLGCYIVTVDSLATRIVMKVLEYAEYINTQTADTMDLTNCLILVGLCNPVYPCPPTTKCLPEYLISSGTQ